MNIGTDRGSLQKSLIKAIISGKKAREKNKYAISFFPWRWDLLSVGSRGETPRLLRTGSASRRAATSSLCWGGLKSRRDPLEPRLTLERQRMRRLLQLNTAAKTDKRCLISGGKSWKEHWMSAGSQPRRERGAEEVMLGTLVGLWMTVLKQVQLVSQTTSWKAHFPWPQLPEAFLSTC